MTEAGAAKGEIAFDAFAALDLRVAKILRAESHPNAEKLVVLAIDLGALGERQIVAGIAQHYTCEQLVGRTIIVVANLKPVKLRGIESRGMLLATYAGERVVLLTTTEDAPPGAVVS